MASHGKSRHQKRLSAPYAQPVMRKTTTWLAKTVPGKHARTHAAPLVVILRDMLKVVADGREAKRVVQAGDVLIDGVKPADIRTPIGPMDIVSLPKAKRYLRVILRHERLTLTDITEAESRHKWCRVQNKRMLTKGKVQINLHDGRNLTLEREEDQFHTGDSIKLAIPSQKMDGVVKMEKGARCFVAYGRHSGELGTLQAVMERAGSKPADALLKGENGNELITLKNYLFAIDSHFKA